MQRSRVKPWLWLGLTIIVAVPLGVWAGERIVEMRAAEDDGLMAQAGSAWDSAVEAGADAWTWTGTQAGATADWFGDVETWNAALQAGEDAWVWTADSSVTAWEASLEAGGAAYDWTTENGAAAWEASVTAGADAYRWSAGIADEAWTWTGETLDAAGTMVGELFEEDDTAQ